ncbi:MAG: hypothetical protein HC929_23540 [Leptolyngbyaceae cyanobacterium SM2_5_2]|nr:hypothetical protein [Leptolyngbyaceae cyanobacterium SM2_5_2]
MCDHEVVYSYIREIALGSGQHETSERVYKLLVDFSAPRNRLVQEALRRIVNAPDFGEIKGLLFINRCIYTAINPLHLDVARHDDLKRLVDRLAKAPSNAQNPDTRKLRRALHRYIQHDMYQCVRRQARLVEPSNQHREEEIFGDLFPRYSFLYFNGTITNDIKRLDAEKQRVKTPSLRLSEGIRRHREKRIYQLRRDLSVYWEQRWQQSAQLVLNPTHLSAFNPTGLSNEELAQGIKLYNTHRPGNFREKASKFSRRYRPDANMSQCRDDVLAYMIQPLDMLTPQHKSRLVERFTHSLKSMESSSGVMKATVIQAFKKILDEMMFYRDNQSAQNFHSLKKYVREISPHKYAAILLNLVLGCPMIIHKLEERLTQIFFHYERMTIESVSWLVKLFEYIHLALVMNYRYFGKRFRLKDDLPPSILWG